MLKFLEKLFFRLLLWSRIVPYVAPYLRRFGFLFASDAKSARYTIVDEGGATIDVAKVNGRLYPVFAAEKVLPVKLIDVRPSDVFLCGYPKTGCHWTYEILRMLTNRQKGLSKGGKGVEGMLELSPRWVMDCFPSPRVLNTHLMYDELPTALKVRNNKIVLTIRSPKDTVVSFFNHTANLTHMYNYTGTFENFFKLFVAGRMEYGHYFEYYADWNRVIRANKQTNINNILIVHYEDLKADTVSEVMRIARFLEFDDVTRAFAESVVEASKFSAMKNTRNGNPVFRKGIVGDWTNWLTDDQSQLLDRMWSEKLANTAFQR